MIQLSIRTTLGALLCTAAVTWGCGAETDASRGAASRSVVSTPLPDTASLRPGWTRALPELDSARVAAVRRGAGGAVWVVARDGRVVRIDGVDDTVTLFPAPDGLDSPAVSGVVPRAGGGVWVRDASSGWILGLSSDGAWVREVRIGAGPLLWGRRALTTDDQGRLWVGIHPPDGPSNMPRAVYARWDGGALVDTIYVPEAVSAECARRDPHFRSGWLEDFRERYVPFPQWTLLPSGDLATGCPEAYSVEIAGAERPGATRAGAVTPEDGNARPRELRIAVDGWVPVPVGTDERNDFKTTWTALMRTRAIPGAETWAWNDASLPSSKPAYTSLLGDSDGNLWVWTAQPSTTVPSNPTWSLAGLPDVLWVETGSGVFDVFDRQGRLVRHLRLPAGLRYTPTPDTPEPDFGRDTVWAALRGPDSEVVVGAFVVTP